MVTEINIKNSFRLVKNDLMKLREEIFVISSTQSDILRKLKEISMREINLAQKGKDNSGKKYETKISKGIYLASKEGKKFHMEKCPYAQNIKPKSKVEFKSKTAALNKGYKACNCVK